MSGVSYNARCPNCENPEADGYSDHKPFNFEMLLCPKCGFTVNHIAKFMNLEELNEAREEKELRKLKKLPKQNKNLEMNTGT